jgi:hypothetical protein
MRQTTTRSTQLSRFSKADDDSEVAVESGSGSETELDMEPELDAKSLHDPQFRNELRQKRNVSESIIDPRPTKVTNMENDPQVDPLFNDLHQMQQKLTEMADSIPSLRYRAMNLKLHTEHLQQERPWAACRILELSGHLHLLKTQQVSSTAVRLFRTGVNVPQMTRFYRRYLHWRPFTA